MADVDTPPKKIEKRIARLKQEKELLQSRLKTLIKYNKPDSRSREQKDRVQLIEDCEKRLKEIEHELKNDRYHLIRVQTEEKIELEDKEKEEESKNKQRKLSNLEKFINQSFKMATNKNQFTSEKPNFETEQTAITTAEHVLNTSTSFFQPRRELNRSPITENNPSRNNIFENPHATVFSTPITKTQTKASSFDPKISSKVSNFNFPKNYENNEERNERLEKEKKEIDDFNAKLRNMHLEPKQYLEQSQYNTGAIRKTYPSYPHIKQQETFNPKPNLNYNHSEQNIIEDDMQTNKNIGHFANYEATPKRLIYEGRPIFKSNNDRSYMYEDLGTYPNRIVQFTSPMEQNFQNQFPEQNIENSRQLMSQNRNSNNTQFNMSSTSANEDFNNPRKTFLRRLKHIPNFNGDTYKELKDFITKADTLYHYCSSEVEENEFYEQMMFQLGEEPKNLLIGMNNPTWDAVKHKLLKFYAHLSNKELLTSQLENLRQEKDETLAKYAERARKLLKEKNSTYSFLSDDQRKEHDRTARRAFARGIANIRIRNVMTIRGSNSLEDAITHSLEAESDALTQIPKNEQFCNFCKIIGHREVECRRKNGNENGNGMNQLISALRSIGNPSQNNFRNSQNTFRNNQRNFNRNGNFNNNNRNWNRNGNRNWNNNNNNSWPNRNWNNNNWSNRNWNNNNRNNGNQNGNYQNNNGNNGNSGNNNNNNFRNNQNNPNNQNRNFQQNSRQPQRANNFADIFNQNEQINLMQFESDSSDSNAQFHTESEN